MPGVDGSLTVVKPATAAQVRDAVASAQVWPVAPVAGEDFVRPEQLAGVAERICARLGGAPLRVGESTYLLGLAARVWAVTLGCVVRDGVLPDPAALRMRDEQGAVQLALAEARGWLDVTPAFLLDQVVAVLEPVVTGSPLSPRLMWGNVASALYATPRVLELPAARPWAAGMLELVPLRGEICEGRRTTCCLFYEAGGGLCGDCVLDRVPVRPAQARG